MIDPPVWARALKRSAYCRCIGLNGTRTASGRNTVTSILNIEGSSMVAPTIRRRLAAFADRPGGRTLLAAISTKWARSLTGNVKTAVIYDGMWIDVVNGVFLPRSRKYQYYAFDLAHMEKFANDRLKGSVDYWTYAYRPKPGDVIIDVGAGIGVDSISLSKLVGPNGHIHSIEAHPWTFAALKKARELNKLSNVSIYNFAIADCPGLVWITDLENDEGNSVAKIVGGQHSIPVQAVDLDSFIQSNRIDEIALLKMNIEGAEELAIRGLRVSIKKISHVVIACHDFRGDLGSTKKPVVEFLRSNGFQVIERPDDPRAYVRDHVHAVRDAAR